MISFVDHENKLGISYEKDNYKHIDTISPFNRFMHKGAKGVLQ